MGFGFFFVFFIFSLVLDFGLFGTFSVFTKPYLRHGKHALDCDHLIAFCVCVFFWAGWDPLRDFACFRFDSLMLVSDVFFFCDFLGLHFLLGFGFSAVARGPSATVNTSTSH